MDGVSLYEVSKLLRHSSIKMTERYAHLAPDHLHQVVADRGFSAQSEFAKGSGLKKGLKRGINGRGERI